MNEKRRSEESGCRDKLNKISDGVHGHVHCIDINHHKKKGKRAKVMVCFDV